MLSIRFEYVVSAALTFWPRAKKKGGTPWRPALHSPGEPDQTTY